MTAVLGVQKPPGSKIGQNLTYMHRIFGDFSAKQYHKYTVFVYIRVVQFEVRSKVRARKTFTHFDTLFIVTHLWCSDMPHDL